MTTIHPTKIILTLLAPFLMGASAWLVGAAGKYGLHLDKSGVNALATAAAAGALVIVVKLIHDLEKRYPTVTRAVETLAGDVEKTVATSDPQLAGKIAAAWPPSA